MVNREWKNDILRKFECLYTSASIYDLPFTIYHHVLNPANIAIRGVRRLPGNAELKRVLLPVFPASYG